MNLPSCVVTTTDRLRGVILSDTFSSMKSLLAAVKQQGNFAFEICTSRRSAIKLFAPHGGCIEPGTAPIIRELAGETYDYFIFRGTRRGGGCRSLLHVTSTRFNEARCRSMSQDALVSFSVHGCRGKDMFIEVGGGNRELARRLLVVLKKKYRAVAGSGTRDGSSPRNFINRALRHGVQLELSEGFRNSLFVNYPKSPRQNPETFPPFITTIRTWLKEIETELGA